MDDNRLLNLLRELICVLFVIASNIYSVPTYLIWTWVILLPLRIFNHPAYWYIEGRLYKWLSVVVTSWIWEAQYEIVEMGEDITECLDQRSLLIANHQSTADVPILMAVLQEKGSMFESLLWIIDSMFRYTHFGAVAVTHGEYFIVEGKSARDHEKMKLTNHLLNNYLVRNRSWIILFPEGGFLSNRKESSRKYAERNNFPVLDRVTLPRLGAIHAIVDTLHPDNLKTRLSRDCHPSLKGREDQIEPLKWVVDVTIAYPEANNPLDLLSIARASRPSCTTYFHYRRYPIENVPSNDVDSLRDWIYERWYEKEELLNEYYSTGVFPQLPRSLREQPGFDEEESHREMRTRQIRFSNLYLALIHMFFLTSSYFHYHLFCRLWSLAVQHISKEIF